MSETQAEVTTETAPEASAPKPSFPGYPITRFNPVYGRRVFEAPNDYAVAGGDDGDWRFTSAGAADQARTHTEAVLAMRANEERALAALREGGEVVSNSVQADASARSGYPEPGVVPAP
ncbi:MAG: hypothetical protein ABF968_12835 [Acetobacter sp.]|uniref:hypothetical protein n=1 Tax=Acetobacteraceae TaxID=433 RepID=UPI00078156F3|nr:hypothetical protein [Gluconobacter oxydans]KXV66632.1 hypothetical protein AD950_01390 [Gluconobacter oxydans]